MAFYLQTDIHHQTLQNRTIFITRVDVSPAFQFKGHFFHNGVQYGRWFMVIFGNSVDLIPLGLPQFSFSLLSCNFGQYLTFSAQEAFW